MHCLKIQFSLRARSLPSELCMMRFHLTWTASIIYHSIRRMSARKASRVSKSFHFAFIFHPSDISKSTKVEMSPIKIPCSRPIVVCMFSSCFALNDFSVFLSFPFYVSDPISNSQNICFYLRSCFSAIQHARFFVTNKGFLVFLGKQRHVLLLCDLPFIACVYFSLCSAPFLMSSRNWWFLNGGSPRRFSNIRHFPTINF